MTFRNAEHHFWRVYSRFADGEPTAEWLASKTDKQLLAVYGIGPKTVKFLRQTFGAEPGCYLDAGAGI